jgi:hypothetical protein
VEGVTGKGIRQGNEGAYALFPCLFICGGTRPLDYFNTLMIQQNLAEPAWSGRLNAQDLRGITPLVYGHVNPYGSFLLCTLACQSTLLA